MENNFYIDSNVFVSAEIKSESTYKDSLNFIKYILENKIPNIYYYTSIFTFLELASAIIRRTRSKDKAYSLLYRVRNSWKKKINPLPPADTQSFTKLIDELIESAIYFKTPSADTIHAQTIAKNNIGFFVTWNIKDFRGLKRKIKDLKIINPNKATEILKDLIKEK